MKISMMKLMMIIKYQITKKIIIKKIKIIIIFTKIKIKQKIITIITIINIKIWVIMKITIKKIITLMKQ